MRAAGNLGRRSGLLNRAGGLTDDFDHRGGVREHGNVTTGEFDDGGLHVNDLETAPSAFIGMLEGRHFVKLLVLVS